MLYSGTDEIEFPSNDSAIPRKYHEEKAKNLKKKSKWVYIIVIISVIILIAVGIFLAIFFAVKKIENGGQIIVECMLLSGNKNIINIRDLDEDDYYVKDLEKLSNIRILSGDKHKNIIIGDGAKHTFKITFNKILTSINGMFENIDYIYSVDFSGLVSNKIVSMNNLFLNCTRLMRVNFNNFDASKLETMDHSFENCKELTEINLESFATPKLYSMKSAFKNCTNLRSLNIENFIINSDVKLQDVFENIDNIYNLKYPKSNGIIKREIEKANFNSNKEGCVIGKNRCTQCNDSDIENLKICASCNDSYFLPNSKYPLGCNQCTNNCRNCTDDLSCIDCENDLVPNNMTGKCEFIQLTDLVSNTIFNLEE